jgi:hypothetical protein
MAFNQFEAGGPQTLPHLCGRILDACGGVVFDDEPRRSGRGEPRVGHERPFSAFDVYLGQITTGKQCKRVHGWDSVLPSIAKAAAGTASTGKAGVSVTRTRSGTNDRPTRIVERPLVGDQHVCIAAVWLE